MKKVTDRLFSIVDRISEVFGELASYLLLIMALMITFGVIMRRFVFRPVPFVDEYSGYLLVIITYLAGAITLKEEGHIRIDLVTTHLKEATKVLLRLITSVVGFVYCAVLTWQGWALFTYSRWIHAKSSTPLETPLWTLQWVIPLSMAFVALQFLALIIKDVRYLQSKTHQEIKCQPHEGLPLEM